MTSFPQAICIVVVSSIGTDSVHSLIARETVRYARIRACNRNFDILRARRGASGARQETFCGELFLYPVRLEPGVRPIAKGRLFRVLTATECHPFFFFKMNLHRRELCSRMGSIAKRLRFRSTTLTPIDSAGPHFDHAWCPSRNHRFIWHGIPSSCICEV